MSIFPKQLKKGKDEYTTFHMKVVNGSDQDIIGQIRYKVTRPDNTVDIMNIDRQECVKANSEINQYDKYFFGKNPLTGRYFVEGRFHWGNESVLSETNENDFFDIEE